MPPLIFSPLIALAAYLAPHALPTAAGVTVLTFAGISAYVLTTKKDFSFLGYGLMLAGWLLFGLIIVAIVMPLLGAPAINPAYHYLAGNRAALPGMVFTMIVGAGFAEETLFRGYLFERLGKLFGTGVGAKVSIVLLTSALFALGHYSNLGLPGVEQAMITGLTFGTIFAITGRIWMVMCAHAAFDLAAVAIIYWNLEATVAHLVFK